MKTSKKFIVTTISLLGIFTLFFVFYILSRIFGIGSSPGYTFSAESTRIYTEAKKYSCADYSTSMHGDMNKHNYEEDITYNCPSISQSNADKILTNLGFLKQKDSSYNYSSSETKERTETAEIRSNSIIVYLKQK